MRNDYIMRMIEQFFRALSEIIYTRKQGDYEKAFVQIQDASRYYLDKEFSELLKLTPEQLLALFIGKEEAFDADRAMICGELFHEMASISKAKEAEEAAQHFTELSFLLTATAIIKDKDFQKPRYQERAFELMQDLSGRDLPTLLNTTLKSYLELVNKEMRS